MLFFAYVILVVATFVLFILFYSDTTDGLSAHSILLHSIENYHANRNLADFVDYLQEQVHPVIRMTTYLTTFSWNAAVQVRPLKATKTGNSAISSTARLTIPIRNVAVFHSVVVVDR